MKTIAVVAIVFACATAALIAGDQEASAFFVVAGLIPIVIAFTIWEVK